MKNTSLRCSLVPWTLGTNITVHVLPKVSRVVCPPRPAHQHAIDGCKIVTADHASTSSRCLKCSDALSRKADPALHWPAGVSQGEAPPTTLKHPSFELHNGHCQMFTCPDARRLEAASCLLRTLSYRSRPSHQTLQLSPLRWGHRLKSAWQSDFFLRRWNLADPTTTAAPGIRAPERPKKSPGNLNAPK